LEFLETDSGISVFVGLLEDHFTFLLANKIAT